MALFHFFYCCIGFHTLATSIQIFLSASIGLLPHLSVSGASCGIVWIVFSVSSGWSSPFPVQRCWRPRLWCF
ncbi:hypothetical protein LINGRAHAP2_LOCUS32005 [Linum grandiflorum]